MENSPYTDATLEIFETLWAGGFTNLGVVLQSALFRTAQDLPRVVGRGARVRLVKGAYKEAAEVAYQRKADVDAAYVMQMQYLLARGDVSGAGHARRRDHRRGQGVCRTRRHRQGSIRVPDAVRRAARPADVARARRDTACASTCRSAASGFPYFMRRLGERPANVAFVLKSLASEK